MTYETETMGNEAEDLHSLERTNMAIECSMWSDVAVWQTEMVWGFGHKNANYGLHQNGGRGVEAEAG